MQMPTPLSMSMPRPRTRPRTRPRARPMTSQGQGQGHCLRDINTQLSPFCIFSIFLVFLKRLVFCVVSVILRVRCYLHLRWHYWPHSGWFQISGVSRKVSFEVWDPTQGVLGFQGLVQSQFLVASWKFKCWCFLDPPTDLLIGVKCRATSVAKNHCWPYWLISRGNFWAATAAPPTNKLTPPPPELKPIRTKTYCISLEALGRSDIKLGLTSWLQKGAFWLRHPLAFLWKQRPALAELNLSWAPLLGASLFHESHYSSSLLHWIPRISTACKPCNFGLFF